MNKMTIARLSLCLMLAVFTRANAGMMSPCSNPIVLPDAKVQVFILPPKAESQLTARGTELATVMQRHILFAALKYSSIGVEELTVDKGQCSLEELPGRITARLRPGQTAIFIASRLFEQGDAIHLQSTVSFTTRDQIDRISWKLAGDAGSTSATVPADPIQFPPRLIPFSFLDTLASAQRESRRMHKTADANSGYWELPADPDARFTFQVIGTQGDWMHIRLLPSNEDGWVQAHALVDGSQLKGAFPELHFIDGLIGYHELWNNASDTSRRRLLQLTLASLDLYIELASGRPESEARALAKVLRGNAILRGESAAGWSLEALNAAEREYQSARSLAPTSTIANNFYLACGLALCARGACAENADRLHDEYLNAIARDPISTELVSNLRALYSSADRGSVPLKLSKQDIATQRAVLQQSIK